jgi:hypothetical protein
MLLHTPDAGPVEMPTTSERFARWCPEHSCELLDLWCPGGHNLQASSNDRTGDPAEPWWVWDKATGQRAAIVLNGRVSWEEWYLDLTRKMPGRDDDGFRPVEAEANRRAMAKTLAAKQTRYSRRRRALALGEPVPEDAALLTRRTPKAVRALAGGLDAGLPEFDPTSPRGRYLARREADRLRSRVRKLAEQLGQPVPEWAQKRV